MAKKKESIPQWILDDAKDLRVDFVDWLHKNFGSDTAAVKFRYSVIDVEDMKFVRNTWNSYAQNILARKKYADFAFNTSHGYRNAFVNNSYEIPEIPVIWLDGIERIYRTTFTLMLSTDTSSYTCSDTPLPIKAYAVKCFNEPERISRVTELSAVITKNAEPIQTMFVRDFPYAQQIMCSSSLPYIAFYAAPQIEQLYKAGYEMLVEDFSHALRNGKRGDTEAFYRLAKPGTNLKTIFAVPKEIYQGLKNSNVSISEWDTYRKLVKFGHISTNSIELIASLHMSDKEFQIFHRILRAQYKGKPVFSLEQLVRYLQRLDVYEALDIMSALPVLDDYLALCRTMNVRPNIETDSLLREHNVMAKLCREAANEKESVKMQAACEKLQEWDYQESGYFIRGIYSQADLVDEAKQQRNCVACYAHYITENTQKVYVMRRKDAPEKSLITISLAPNGRTIFQKLTARNQPIRNSQQQEVLKHWVEWIRLKDRGPWQYVSEAMDAKFGGKAPYAEKTKALDLYFKTRNLSAAVDTVYQQFLDQQQAQPETA